MEQQLIIAEILRHKPHGIKLYSPIFGNCTFCYVKDKSSDICVRRPYNEVNYFNFDGVYHTGGECLLFPSNEMRDWSKFAWQKGDLLINSCGFQCIFKEWASDDYTKFNGCYSNSRDGYEDVSNAETAKFNKLDNNTTYKYVREIERKLGGKLNLKTLEIEKQSEFKDGDIIKMTWDKYSAIVIFWEYSNFEKGFNSHVFFNIEKKFIKYNIYDHILKDTILRLATEEEKKKLFDALAKRGKVWDAEKKQIVDLKLKWIPKPFDRVITRNDDDDIWTANIFSHMDSHGEYVTIGCVGGYTYCIPYNKENAKLIGTTNNVEG